VSSAVVKRTDDIGCDTPNLTQDARRVTSIRDLVPDIAATGTGGPRLTWYGSGGERIDLSGRVLANWMIKATNLLLEEAEAGPGTRVLVDLPVHWRTLIWTCAAWTTGATVVLPGADDCARRGDSYSPGDVVVTTRPELVPPGPLVIAVALPALAMHYPGSLPARAIDGAADLMTYPDALGALPPLEADATGLVAAGGASAPAHRDLLAWAGAVAGRERWPDVPRVLSVSTDPAAVLAAAMAAWSSGGSIVLVTDRALDADAVARAERATVRA
jgi:uncharacterized protein (TIGR03089 family)